MADEKFDEILFNEMEPMWKYTGCKIFAIQKIKLFKYKISKSKNNQIGSF